jgi:GTP-binding protein LepA
VTGEKSVREVQIGDTILTHDTLKAGITKTSCIIPGFKKVKPFVYAGVYPIDSTDYDKLKDSLEKLSLNDSAIEYELEDSKALGFGFRCGFLGMLHMDIIKERLSREYGMETIFTIPTVVYLVRSKNLSLDVIKLGNNIQSLIQTGLWKQLVKDKEKFDEDLFVNGIPSELQAELKPWMVVKSGADMVEQGLIEEIREPIATVEIVGPQEFAGNIMQLCQEYRGKLKHMDYIDSTRVVRHYQLPMGEMIIDFYDRLKSATKGYATMNYEFQNYQEADLVKLDIFINNEKVEALSWVVHNDNAYYKGRDAVERLKELIPKHLFSIPIQAGIGTKMIARETISAMKKDVLAKCYGGDVSRKRKLLEKQKEERKN